MANLVRCEQGRRTCRSNKRTKASVKRRPRSIRSENKTTFDLEGTDRLADEHHELCSMKTCRTGNTLLVGANFGNR